ncbi:hypothetical protein FCV25MIE_32317 [Fagus crenata]
MEDTGVSVGMGEMDMHDAPNVYPEDIVHGAADIRADLVNIVATCEAQAEVERSATVAPLSTDFQGYNLVVDDTDAILLVGVHVTMLPISRDQSANSKGKSVVGTTPRAR